jgi:hypothetical protein
MLGGHKSKETGAPSSSGATPVRNSSFDSFFKASPSRGERRATKSGLGQSRDLKSKSSLQSSTGAGSSSSSGEENFSSQSNGSASSSIEMSLMSHSGSNGRIGESTVEEERSPPASPTSSSEEHSPRPWFITKLRTSSDAAPIKGQIGRRGSSADIKADLGQSSSARKQEATPPIDMPGVSPASDSENEEYTTVLYSTTPADELLFNRVIQDTQWPQFSTSPINMLSNDSEQYQSPLYGSTPAEEIRLLQVVMGGEYSYSNGGYSDSSTEEEISPSTSPSNSSDEDAAKKWCNTRKDSSPREGLITPTIGRRDSRGSVIAFMPPPPMTEAPNIPVPPPTDPAPQVPGRKKVTEERQKEMSFYGKGNARAALFVNDVAQKAGESSRSSRSPARERAGTLGESWVSPQASSPGMSN